MSDEVNQKSDIGGQTEDSGSQRPDIGSQKSEVWRAALAGLLHDVGKFSWRAEQTGNHSEAGARWVEEHQDLFPREMWEDLTDAAAEHHVRSPHKRIAKIVKLADWLAASERQTEDLPRSEPALTPLVPILSRVALINATPQEQRSFDLKPLDLDNLFPQRRLTTLEADAYANLREPFEEEVKKAGITANTTDMARFVSLSALLRKYMTFAPSATPWEKGDEIAKRTLPDVSLYDHLKITAAIAACLEQTLSDDELDQLLGRDQSAWQKPVALLVRGDFSGIQNFIYRITRPEGEGEYARVAKRLRGRSFYLQLLGEVVVDWLIRELGVTPANVLFSGGGRFDILAPVNARPKVQECEEKLTRWLLDKFFGELGIVIACADVRPGDFGDMRSVYDAADEELAECKRRKWDGLLMDETFLKPDWKKYHACPVCNITPVDEPQDICDQCCLHGEIGGKLPHVTHLAVVYGKTWPQVKGAVIADFAQFDRAVLLLAEQENEARRVLAALGQNQQAAVIYRLNDTSDFISPDAPRQVGQTFRFLANAAPTAKQKLALSDGSIVQPEDVLPFELIAALSNGVRRIGILKADVDRLGLIFGLGLQPPTISRVTALSGTIDLFFCGWLNKLCEKVFEDWQEEQSRQATSNKPVNNLYGKVEGLFYVMYSGGDDLFIIGPWDSTLKLAQSLQNDFAKYACCNPNVTLSAGYVQVKPHYPVQRFAELVSNAEKAAKDKGRNQITAFGETVEWTNGEAGYKELLEFAVELCKWLESDKIPRTLVHDLGQMKRVRDKTTDELKPLYSPRLHYTLTRRVRDEEVRKALLESSIINKLKHIMLPVSYVSLITRKE